MMNFLARVVRFLFWLLIVSWGFRLLRRLVAAMFRDANPPSPQSADAPSETQMPIAGRRLVRDPVCGMHVDETLSIPLREAGELVHFCSVACRDAYAGETKKFAANG
jgi:YHS domain-containing protein